METNASMGEVPITIIITSDLPCLQRLKGQHYLPEPQPKKVCMSRSAGAYEISCNEKDVDLIPPHMLPSLCVPTLLLQASMAHCAILFPTPWPHAFLAGP